MILGSSVIFGDELFLKTEARMLNKSELQKEGFERDVTSSDAELKAETSIEQPFAAEQPYSSPLLNRISAIVCGSSGR